MADLELELRSLTVEWPETPDLSGAVQARLERESAVPAGGRAPARRGVRRLRGWTAGLAYGAAALLAALAVTMAVSPAARSAILEFLGLKSVRIERREPNAPPPPPRRAPLGADLGLGDAASAAAAGREAGFRVLVPRLRSLGRPDAVYLGRSRSGLARVSLVYGARPGIRRSRETGAALLVMELRAATTPVIEKSLGAGARLERFRLDGRPAIFISGKPHGFAYVDDVGQIDFEDQRLAGNTLLVERADGLLLRVEGRLDRAAAIAVARSVR
jgi:hypothetical protein